MKKEKRGERVRERVSECVFVRERPEKASDAVIVIALERHSRQSHTNTPRERERSNKRERESTRERAPAQERESARKSEHAWERETQTKRHREGLCVRERAWRKQAESGVAVERHSRLTQIERERERTRTHTTQRKSAGERARV